MRLKLIDKKILAILDRNARTPATQIARELHASKATVNYRIKRLIKNKYISTFYTMMNLSRLGYQYFRIFFTFQNTTPTIDQKILQYITQQPLCAEIILSEGTYDMVLLVLVKRMRTVQQFLTNFKEQFGQYLLQKETHITLHTQKHLQQHFYPKWSTTIELDHDEKTDYKLDDTDRTLLDILSNNANISAVKLAKKANVHTKVAMYRMKKLENENIIAGYTITPNYDKLQKTTVFILISLTTQKQILTIKEFFLQTNTCTETTELLGKYDLLITLTPQNTQELKNIIEDFRERFAQHYTYYDILHITEKQVTGWSPYTIDE